MDMRDKLEQILRRRQLSAMELALQPEVFQARHELRLASGELSSVIEKFCPKRTDRRRLFISSASKRILGPIDLKGVNPAARDRICSSSA